MIILGIDPGLASTGAVVLNADRKLQILHKKVLRTRSDIDTAERLTLIAQGIEEIIKTYHPSILAIETAFIRRDAPQAGLSLGKVLGVILLTGFQNNLTIVEITPRQAKETLTGYGNAYKEQIERAVKVKLGLREPLKPSHVSDAAAIALTAASNIATLGSK